MKNPLLFALFLFRRNLALIGSVALLLYPASVAHAANLYYVALTGNDMNPGTSAAPFRTIAKGVAAAVAGDTIIVADGTYGPEGKYTCGIDCSQHDFGSPVEISKSGAPSAPITIKAEHKWKAILTCGLPDGYSGDGTDGVQACDAYFTFLGDSSYFVIQDFDISHSFWTGIHINGTNHDIVIKGNHIHHIGNRHYVVPAGVAPYGIAGVYAGKGTSHITFDGNVFNNNGRLPTSGQTLTDYNHDHGIYIYGGNYTITNNVFYNHFAGWGIQTSPGTHDIFIYNNTFSGANPNRDGQITLWADSTHPHNNIKIINNIFYKPRNFAITSSDDYENNSVIQNNVVCCTGVDVVDKTEITGTLTVANNKINTDPSFMDMNLFDFHLKSGSPAIDAGITTSPAVNIDLDGNTRLLSTSGTIDVGAMEHMGTSGSTPLPLTVPTGLVATAISSSQINLLWTALPANNVLAGYKIFRNGGQIATSILPSYADMNLNANTSYSYTIAAYDLSGTTTGQSPMVSATTKPTADTIPPVVSITNPLPGTTVSGKITIKANATDNKKLAGVQFQLDGTNLGAEDTMSTYKVDLDTTKVSNAIHTMTAIARDSSNNTATASIAVTVRNVDSIAPKITYVRVKDLKANSATITWSTNEPANSKVEFGSAGVLDHSIIDGQQVTSHVLVVTGLLSYTKYSFKVTSEDGARNSASSIVSTFTTPRL